MGGGGDEEHKERGMFDDGKDHDDGSHNGDGGGADSDDCDEDVHIKGHNNYWRWFDVWMCIQEPSRWTA